MSAPRRVLLLCLLPFTAAWFGVPNQRYVEERLIDTGSLGLPSTGMVVAFGDVNSDQLLDLFMLSSDQRTVSTWIWDRPSYQYKEQIQSRIQTAKDFIVVNVVPGDYNYDGKLDLLLMGQENPGSWWGEDSDEILMQVHLQELNSTFSSPHSVNSSTLAQPIPLDATGDMNTDLLAFSTDTKKLELWQNSWSDSNHTEIFQSHKPPLDLTDFNCTFPTPHFNAFIDLDGDCLADLFLTCKNGNSETDLSYQIWLNDKSGGFKLARIGNLPTGTKSVGFADMDRDGTIDMVITSCPTPSKCSLQIAYNSQVPLCSTSTRLNNGPCRDPEALCVADPEFSFNLTIDPNNHDFTSIPINALVSNNNLVTATSGSSSFRGTLPVSPQIGDFNIDGYPDLLLLTSPTSSTGFRSITILESRPCDRTVCSSGEVVKGRRAFRVVTKGAEVLIRMDDVESAHWIDLDDDGSLDILVQRASGVGGAARKINFIKNNYFNDAFFLKALVLNGACQGWCEPRDQARFRPYGVSYSGASFKFTVLDPTGARKATQVGQLPQTSYLSLGTPYSYFGLGRTNNYVENLFIGSTRHQPQHFINVEGLIPNSMVVILPWQPLTEKSEEGQVSSWSKELYLRPGEWIPIVGLILSVSIGLLGCVVLLLHLAEKREDEVERRTRLIQLNFSAL